MIALIGCIISAIVSGILGWKMGRADAVTEFEKSLKSGKIQFGPWCYHVTAIEMRDKHTGRF
jgi:hypothetical protein